MDISTLMQIGGGNLKLEVTAADLTKFAKDVVDMTLAARSKELTKTGANAINGETYLSSGQVCDKLGIAKSTLWLWQKRGIIAPKKVGSHNRYALSDIVRLLNNGQLGNVPVDYPSGNIGCNADETGKKDDT